MSRRQVDIIVLCEDCQHEAFIRRFLRGLGYDRRRITVRPYPVAKGAAEQYVRERYPIEVKAIRQQPKRENLGLLTMIDADLLSVSERQQQFNEARSEAGQAPRGTEEKLAVLVPRRNLETWIYRLDRNEAVDELQDYKSRLGFVKREGQCQPAVEEFVRLCQSGTVMTDEEYPPSLCAAPSELRRLPPR